MEDWYGDSEYESGMTVEKWVHPAQVWWKILCWDCIPTCGNGRSWGDCYWSKRFDSICSASLKNLASVDFNAVCEYTVSIRYLRVIMHRWWDFYFSFSFICYLLQFVLHNINIYHHMLTQIAICLCHTVSLHDPFKVNMEDWVMIYLQEWIWAQVNSSLVSEGIVNAIKFLADVTTLGWLLLVPFFIYDQTCL